MGIKIRVKIKINNKLFEYLLDWQDRGFDGGRVNGVLRKGDREFQGGRVKGVESRGYQGRDIRNSLAYSLKAHRQNRRSRISRFPNISI